MLHASNVSLEIQGRSLITDLDWRASPGECWCVIGPNGAGKSTLLRTLAGLQEPSAGAVCWMSQPLSQWPHRELARARAYLPQERADAFGYTVLETVLAARHSRSTGAYWESEQDHLAARAALAEMQVEHLAPRDVRTLSGGERRRVAIAAVLAQDASLLLLDEPANALDLAHQVGVMHLLARLCRDDGKLAVFVSHDLNLAGSIASHALLLTGDGRWHAGPAADMMRASLLGQCLGHPIEEVRHGTRTIFLPMQPP